MQKQKQTSNLKTVSINKIAVIGYGYWGQKLAATLAKFNQQVVVVELVKIKLPETFSFSNLETALADETIKAVVIATPEFTHAELIKLALKANKPVLVEKPATTATFEWQNISEMALAQKLPIVVDYTFLESRALVSWKKLELKYASKLGNLIKLTSIRQSQLSHEKILAKKLPIWWDVAIHDIYLIKDVWHKSLINWSVKTIDPTDKATLVANFSKVKFEAIYGWSELPARQWQADFEHGQLIWKRENGLEIIQAYFSGELINQVQILDSDPSPLDGVVLKWLKKISLTTFNKTYWQNYWSNVFSDIETINAIDVAYKKPIFISKKNL